MVNEHNFRLLCRREHGGIEAEAFGRALETDTNDPVTVEFSVGIDDVARVPVARADAIEYARIAKEERQPEDELIKHIKPDAWGFVRYNRKEMCGKLRRAMVESLSENRPLTILWPIWTPDVVPRDVALKYLERYE